MTNLKNKKLLIIKTVIIINKKNYYDYFNN